MQTQFIIDPPADAQSNMDRDCTLFQQGTPVVRFYGWEQRSFSIGYFQSENKVREILPAADQNCPVVKRITGGGVVEHGKDITFSIVVPNAADWGLENVQESYLKINQMAVSALRQLEKREGISQLPALSSFSEKPDTRERTNYFCFKKPTKYDLMMNGIKIGGGAQRRTGGKLLHQGSLQMQMDEQAKKQFIQFFYQEILSLSKRPSPF
jgi:lipoate-protein ligase A